MQFSTRLCHIVHVNVNVKTAIAKRPTLPLSSRSARFQMLVFQGLFATLSLQSFIRWNHQQTIVTSSSRSYSNNGPTHKRLYDMTKRTLIELVSPYPHFPITMQSSGISDTAGLGFWCMFTFLHMQFQFGYQSNNCLCSRQPSRFTPSNYIWHYIQ